MDFLVTMSICTGDTRDTRRLGTWSVRILEPNDTRDLEILARQIEMGRVCHWSQSVTASIATATLVQNYYKKITRRSNTGITPRAPDGLYGRLCHFYLGRKVPCEIPLVVWYSSVVCVV